MTTMSQFDRIYDRLPELLDELGAPSLPDYTDELLIRTSATRQRPRWTFIERWLPMGVIARERIYLPRVPWRLVAVAALLVATLIAVLLAAGSRQRLPAPFGPAGNGRLVIDSGGDIYIRNSLTDQQRLLVGGTEEDIAPAFARDGTKLSFLRLVEEGRGRDPDIFSLMLANADGTGLRQVVARLEGPAAADWSPDGKHIVGEQKIDGRPQLTIIDVESGTVTPLYNDFPAFTPMYRGPDGREIIFRGWVRTEGPSMVNMFAIQPDGSGLREIGPRDADTGGGYRDPLLSPDGRYVLYSQFDETETYRVHRLEIDTGDVDVLHLGPEGGNQGFASYSPDGRYLLFHWISNDNHVQVMVAPADGNGSARAVGPAYPVVGESATLQQTFSPDGKLVIVNHGRDQVTMLLDLAKDDAPEILPWDAEGTPVWQRVAMPG